MGKTKTLLLAVALLVGAAGPASAQVACPANNRITFSTVNLLDGAAYEVFVGISGSLGSVAGVVFRNGVCQQMRPAFKNGLPTSTVLPSGTNNICLGSGADRIHVLTAGQLISCGGNTFPLQAMNYGGNRLTTYGGSGNDIVDGGLGNDTMFGGFGQDQLNGRGGSDTLNGENDADSIGGGSGATTINSGSGNDIVVDSSGADQLQGGSGNDIMDAKCNAASTLLCDEFGGTQGASDSAFYRTGRPFPDFTGCERWTVNPCP